MPSSIIKNKTSSVFFVLERVTNQAPVEGFYLV